MAWPKEVPVLTGSDIFRGDYHSPSGRTHCLIGWAATTFRETYEKPPVINDGSPFCVALAAIQSCFTRVEFTGTHGYISNFNDGNPAKDVARIWNKAMTKLGYTEGNPEAKGD